MISMKNHMKKYVALSLAAAIVAGSAGVYAITTSTNAQTSDTTSSSTTEESTFSAQAATSGSTSTDATNQTPPDKPDGSSDQTPPGQSSQTSVSYSATKKIAKSTTIKKGTYKSSTSFYGTNSGILASGGANLTLNNITVTTNATGANGVFCYGGSATTENSSSDGTTVTIKNSKITTKADNSGGIMTTGGGTMNAYNLTVKTAGTSSAAIRTDRGGGTVKVNKGTYTTTGKGSPAVYSTADVTVSNATLKATASEGVVIEGKNKVTLKNCTLTDNNTTLNGQSTTYKNVFLYQSMSGDAASGNSVFNAVNSKITTKKGDSFYITNTSATINLTNNTITNADSTYSNINFNGYTLYVNGVAVN